MHKQNEYDNEDIVEAKSGVGIIHVNPNLGTKAISGNFNKINADELSVAAASSAMKNLSSDFHNWMGDEVARLEAIANKIKDPEECEKNKPFFYKIVQDTRDQAQAFGYPLAGKVANSLLRLINRVDISKVSTDLIMHHIDAIKVIHRDEVRDYANPIAMQIVHHLNTGVDRVIGLERKNNGGNPLYFGSNAASFNQKRGGYSNPLT